MLDDAVEPSLSGLKGFAGEEKAMALAAPALYVNGIACWQTAAGLRIAFFEGTFDVERPAPRGGILVDAQTALALHEMLGKYLSAGKVGS